MLQFFYEIPLLKVYVEVGIRPNHLDPVGTVINLAFELSIGVNDI